MRNTWWLNWGFLMPIIGMIVAGVAFYAGRIWRGRRRARIAYEKPPMSGDFTLGELDQLRTDGKISPEQCEKAKASVLRKNQVITERANMRSTGGFPVIAPHSPDEPPKKT
jgi:hypothetical protein